MSGRISIAYGAVPEAAGLASAMLQMWHAISRHRRLFLGGCLSVWVLGGLVLAILRPVYTATATVAVAPQSVDPLAPAGQAQADPFQDDDLPQTIAAAMQSRDVAAAVLAQIPASTVKPVAGGPASDDPAVTEQAAIDDFLKRLTVTPESHSRVIDVDMAAGSAALAQALANAVVANYQKISLAQQVAQSAHVAAWMNARIADLQARWLAAAAAADGYRSANRMTEISDGANTIPLIDQQISAAATSLEAAQAELIDAQALHDTGHGEVASTQPAAAAAANMLVQLETARSQMAGEFGPNYPKVKTLDAQIAALRSAPAADSAMPPVAPGSGLAAAKARVDSLTARLDQLTLQEAAQGLAQANYLTLQAEAENAHSAYSTFVEHAAEVADRASLLQPAIAVISPAGLPLRPSFPDRPKLGLGILLFGLVVGAGICLFRDQPAGIAPGFGLTGGPPVIAALPFVPDRPGRSLAHHVLDDPYSRTSEAMRAIADRLALPALRAGRASCILVASAGPQEGRTTIATWLACLARQHGEKVLLISAASPQGPTAPGSQAAAKLGLSDLIFGNAVPEQVIETDPFTRLDLISAGSIAGRPFESTDRARLLALLAALQGRYALVVIDPPPLLNSPDGLLLSAVADTTIFVCRWQHTAPRAVTAAIDGMQAKGAQVAGIVVSMVHENASLAFDENDGGRELSLLTQLYGA